MLKIGITGGIGSGKSIVCKILESMNYPVFYSDREAKIIIKENLDVRSEIIRLFGNDIYHGDQLNSNLLAQIIFNDADALNQVNAIIHPKVRNSFTDYADQQDSQYVFNEAAILIESGGYKQMDTVVLISAPLELRVSRVMLRDACTEDEVTERISKQWADNQKRKYCDFEIVNANNLALLGQVESLIEGLKK